MFSGNSTFLSWQEHSDGAHYSADFEYYPFHEGQSEAFFKGRWIGEFRREGCRTGEKCIVRTCLDDFGTVETWESTLKIWETASAVVDEFNKKIMKRRAIVLKKPILAEIDRLSAMNKAFKFFKRHRKKLHKGEMVLLEDYLPKADFQYFLMTDYPRLFGLKENEILEAFCHFSWEYSKGQYIICDLQGIRRSRSFVLTDPKIHSAETDEEETLVLSPIVCDQALNFTKVSPVPGSMSNCSQSLSDVCSDASDTSDLSEPHGNEVKVEAIIETRFSQDTLHDSLSRDTLDSAGSLHNSHKKSIKELREDFFRPLLFPAERSLQQSMSAWELRTSRSKKMSTSKSEVIVTADVFEEKTRTSSTSSAPSMHSHFVSKIFDRPITKTLPVNTSKQVNNADDPVKNLQFDAYNTTNKRSISSLSPQSDADTNLYPIVELKPSMSSRVSSDFSDTDDHDLKYVDDTDKDSGVTLTASSVEQDLNEHHEDSAYSSQGYEHFGMKDRGSEVIKSFFRYHLCNDICNTFSRPIIC